MRGAAAILTLRHSDDATQIQVDESGEIVRGQPHRSSIADALHMEYGSGFVDRGEARFDSISPPRGSIASRIFEKHSSMRKQSSLATRRGSSIQAWPEEGDEMQGPQDSSYACPQSMRLRTGVVDRMVFCSDHSANGHASTVS